MFAYACTACESKHRPLSVDHNTLAILYSIVNLEPRVRSSLKRIMVACLCRDADAKAVGMVEVMNGGSTSLGAQLRELATPTKLRLRARSGFGDEDRLVTVHAPLFTADFPQAAAFLPTKGSTSAHCYDRHSDMDQRSEHYGEKNSFLRKGAGPV